MKDTLRCPMCGTRTIHRSTGRPGDLVMMYLGGVKTFLGRGQTTAPFYAHVCSDCGFAELHVDLEDVDTEGTDIETLVGKDPTPDTPYR